MEPIPPAIGPEPEVSPVVPSSLASRLANVFAEPGQLFGALRLTPASTANWLAPALLLIVTSWVGAWLILSQDTIKQQLTNITDQAIEKQIAKANMPADQAERAREAGAKFGSIGIKASVVATPVLYAFITPFWWGLILWLVGTKAFRGVFPYMKAVEAAGLANMIGVLESVIKTLLIVAFGNLFASPSLALLVSNYDPENTVHGLLAMVNVMTFWLLAIRAIGLAKLSGTSFTKAAAWVFGIWFLFTGSLFGFGQLVKALFAR